MDRRHFVAGSAATAAALTLRPAFAQDAYPAHAVTFINPFPPGGAADVVGRPMAALLEPILKQPCIIETKAGAAGQVGGQVAATAKPDGYTLLIHIVSISGFAEVDKLFGRQPKFTRADFIPIARLTSGPMVLLVNDQQPYKSVKELVTDAKANPEQTDLQLVGTCTARCTCRPHCSCKATGIKMKHLPTNGGGPALTAILGNNSQVLVSAVAPAFGQIKAGKLRAAGLFQPATHGVSARCADPERARLRRRIFIVGRRVCPEGHTGFRRQDYRRSYQEGSHQRSVQDCHH